MKNIYQKLCPCLKPKEKTNSQMHQLDSQQKQNPQQIFDFTAQPISNIDIKRLVKNPNKITSVRADSYSSSDEDSKRQFSPAGKLITKQIRWKSSGVIGQGSYGRVLQGMDQDSGHQIAIKQVELKSKNLNDPRIQALQKEITLLSRLHHKNIVSYLGMEKTEFHLNIFLEYVGGGSLSNLILKFGPLSESVVKNYMKQILNGLNYLHSHGVLHRDIKGANVLVDKNGICKLADFGSSIRFEEINFKHVTITGTPNWMAPEVMREEQCGKKADIWSLGCMMIEMLTGQPPWGNFQNPLHALYTISEKNQPPPIPEDCSQLASDFLQRCLKMEPQQRYSCRRLLNHPFLQMEKKQSYSSHQQTQLSQQSKNRQKSQSISTLKSRNSSRRLINKVFPSQDDCLQSRQLSTSNFRKEHQMKNSGIKLNKMGSVELELTDDMNMRQRAETTRRQEEQNFIIDFDQIVQEQDDEKSLSKKKEDNENQNENEQQKDHKNVINDREQIVERNIEKDNFNYEQMISSHRKRVFGQQYENEIVRQNKRRFSGKQNIENQFWQNEYRSNNKKDEDQQMKDELNSNLVIKTK